MQYNIPHSNGMDNPEPAEICHAPYQIALPKLVAFLKMFQPHPQDSITDVFIADELHSPKGVSMSFCLPYHRGLCSGRLRTLERSAFSHLLLRRHTHVLRIRLTNQWRRSKGTNHEKVSQHRSRLHLRSALYHATA